MKSICCLIVLVGSVLCAAEAQAIEPLTVSEMTNTKGQWFRDCNATVACNRLQGFCPCNRNLNRCTTDVLGGRWFCDGLGNVDVCGSAGNPFLGCRKAGGAVINCGEKHTMACDWDDSSCVFVLGCDHIPLSTATGVNCRERNCRTYAK